MPLPSPTHPLGVLNENAGVLAFTRRPASDDAAKHERISRDLARAANEAILQRDRAVLRQLVAATKDGAYARAYDLARRLQLRESLDLARRIAASHGEDALTARVEDLIAVADGTTGEEAAMDEAPVAPAAPRPRSPASLSRSGLRARRFGRRRWASRPRPPSSQFSAQSRNGGTRRSRATC